MTDDDRVLDLVGLAVGALVVVAIAVLVLAGATAPQRGLPPEPNATWTIERTAVAEVAITHAGGEPVEASELVISIAGVERPPNRSDTLTEGEAIGVAARSGQSVKLFWVAGRDERVLLDEWVAP